MRVAALTKQILQAALFYENLGRHEGDVQAYVPQTHYVSY